jgi:hypothetical protein
MHQDGVLLYEYATDSSSRQRLSPVDALSANTLSTSNHSVFL